MPGTTLPPQIDRVVNSLLARIERLERQIRQPAQSGSSDSLWTLDAGELKPKPDASDLDVQLSGPIVLESTASNIAVIAGANLEIGGAGNASLIASDITITAGAGSDLTLQGGQVELVAGAAGATVDGGAGGLTILATGGIVNVESPVLLGTVDAGGADFIPESTSATAVTGSIVAVMVVDVGGTPHYIPIYGAFTP